MTNQEAIRYFETIRTHVDMRSITGLEADQAIEMAISALQAQETCDDTISRQAAIDAVDKNFCQSQRIRDAIEALPSTQPHSNELSKTQMSLDCISRQAAIDALIGDGPPELNYDFYYAEKIKELPSVRNGIMISKEDLLEALNSINLPVVDAVNKIFEVIQDMPSAQPEQRWIPVTERLPEEGIDALCCFYNGQNSKIIVSRRTDYNYWNGVGRTGDMVAWMPLPDPYREDGGE